MTCLSLVDIKSLAFFNLNF